MHSPLAAALAAASVFGLTATAARAEPPRPASRPAEESPASSRPASRPAASDLDDIERALSQDQSQAKEKREAPAPASPSGGFLRSLQSLNPDISFIADVALAAWSTRTPLLMGGHDPAHSGFTLQALELAVAGAVDPYFRFTSNIVFTGEGVEVEEVYATSLALPWNLQVRAGQFLTAFGRLNATHPHTWEFLDQPLVLGKFFGGDGNRGLGVEVSELLPLPWYVELVGSMNSPFGASTARSFYGDSDRTVDGPRDFEYMVAAKQFFPLGEDLSLLFGLSAAFGPNPSGPSTRTDLYGTDLYLKYRPIQRASNLLLGLQAEWMLRRRQTPTGVLQDHGFYGYLVCRFAPRWTVAVRYEYVSGVEGDPLDPDWNGLRQRASANLTFYPTEFSRLRLEYDYDHPSWTSGYHGVMLGFEFAVGAHGAHTF
jgi:hypothetical protein